MADASYTVEDLLTRIADRAAFLHFFAMCATSNGIVPEPSVFAGLADLCEGVHEDAVRVRRTLSVDTLQVIPRISARRA